MSAAQKGDAELQQFTLWHVKPEFVLVWGFFVVLFCCFLVLFQIPFSEACDNLAVASGTTQVFCASAYG